MSNLRLLPVLACLLLQGCITRSTEVRAAVADAAEFAAWSCVRIDDELDEVQHQAADVAYSVDAQAGNNILAMGLGVMVFWPAMLAMRPDGLEAADLARLKGRFDALSDAARRQGCVPAGDTPSAARAATLALSPGESLVYEDRIGPRGASRQWVLQVDALRRGGLDYLLRGSGRVLQDHSGNIVMAPEGELSWPHLLRQDLRLGAVTAGDIVRVGDPYARARMRGQVVAVGPQTVAGRRFDVAVVELFGDTERDREAGFTRVDGAIVVDRNNGVLLRLDLRSIDPGFSLQRRLVRVDAALPDAGPLIHSPARPGG
ncbi:MAG: hypothetical protein ABIN96_00475 [Rubrivivax sp.]